MGELTINKEKVLAALSTVQEPDLKKDLVTLNMIKDIEIGINQITFTVVLTTPACPLKELIKKNCLDAITAHFGEGIDVRINLTAEVATSINNSPLMPGVKNIIAVASGKGGVGKSTVTANLALALARSGAKVGIIDADIFGPSIPIMFGVEDLQPMVQQVGGKNLLKPIKQFGVKLMSMGFLTPPDQAIVWRGPMASQALKQFFGDVDWGDLDYLFIDLPPGTSDIHMTMASSVPITGAIIVTTPQKVAIADASKGIAMFRQPAINIPVLGIVENMAFFTPKELPDNKYYIFGRDGAQELAEKYNTEVIGQIPLVQSVREGGDEGRPVVIDKDEIVAQAFQATAEKLSQKISILNVSKATA